MILVILFLKLSCTSAFLASEYFVHQTIFCTRAFLHQSIFCTRAFLYQSIFGTRAFFWHRGSPITAIASFFTPNLRISREQTFPSKEIKFIQIDFPWRWFFRLTYDGGVGDEQGVRLSDQWRPSGFCPAKKGEGKIFFWWILSCLMDFSYGWVLREEKKMRMVFLIFMCM